jgi:mannosyltransferase
VGRHSEDAVTRATALCAAIAVAAYLRLDGLGVPSFWLDEILHQQLLDQYRALPWWRWLGRLHEEHAGLYYLTQLATRLFGTGEGAARLAAALFGIATVPLAWLVVLSGVPGSQPGTGDGLRARRSSEIAAFCAALLLAVSPLHVYFSREARSYALLTLLTAALVLVLLHARSLPAAVAVLVAMLYTSAVSATIVLSALAVAAVCAFVLPERRRWYATVAAFCVVTLALFRVVYAARPVAEANWPGFPPVDARFFAALLRTFSVSAFGTEIAGRTAVAMLLFAIVGAVALFRADRRAGVVVVGLCFLPVAISLAVLKTLDHFYAQRYVMPAVFGYTVLAGIGIANVALWSAGLSARHHDGLRARRSRWMTVIAALIAIITAIQMWPSARAEPFRKLDWRAVAAVIASHAHPGDAILAAEPWSDVSLRWYLARHPRAPGVLQMPHVPIAERIRLSYPATFIVTAGYDESEMRRWACGLPMLAASPLENFRLHYASATSDFVRERGGPAEFRAAAPLNQLTFGEGWAPLEQDFRWVVGTRATLSFVNWGARERVLRMRVLPSTPGQTMNGRALPDEWSEQRMVIPAKDGINTVTLEFSRTHVPGGRDRRPLAAAFADVVLDQPPPAAFVIRSAAGALLDQHTGWRGRKIRVTGPFRREQVVPLLARLGFDAAAVWPRLARGELHIENLAETIAYGQDCVDGETFLRLACAILLDRLPYDTERALAARMPRAEMVRSIVRSDEFARRYVQGVIPSEVEESPADGTGVVHR